MKSGFVSPLINIFVRDEHGDRAVNDSQSGKKSKFATDANWKDLVDLLQNQKHVRFISFLSELKLSDEIRSQSKSISDRI